jgi:hypothetical protein
MAFKDSKPPTLSRMTNGPFTPPMVLYRNLGVTFIIRGSRSAIVVGRMRDRGEIPSRFVDMGVATAVVACDVVVASSCAGKWELASFQLRRQSMRDRCQGLHKRSAIRQPEEAQYISCRFMMASKYLLFLSDLQQHIAHIRRNVSFISSRQNKNQRWSFE